MTHRLPWSAAIAAWFLTPAALAGGPGHFRAEVDDLDVHTPERPFKLGSRAGVWTGPYSAPALGGHVKIAASEGVGLEGFADHTLRVGSGVARHDHVIGFHAYSPKWIGTERWYVSPTLGACVDFRIDSPLSDRTPSNTDVLFGTHAGGLAEVAVGRGWSLEASATGFLYFGNETGTADWTATASNKLHTSAVAQIIGGLNYRL